MKQFDDWIALFALFVIFCVVLELRYDDTESWSQFKHRCESIKGAQAVRVGVHDYQCVPTVDAVAKQKLEAL